MVLSLSFWCNKYKEKGLLSLVRRGKCGTGALVDKDRSCGFVLAVSFVREDAKKGHTGASDLGERSLLEMGRSGLKFE